MNILISYLRLMRPANIVTAVADILLGAAAAYSAAALTFHLYYIPVAIPWLILSTIGLYGGGVVLNDVFDATLDGVERPERPIPSGIIPLKHAALLGTGLLLMGVAAAFEASVTSGILAIAICIAVVLYDAVGKHQNIFGPINMGICRGLNLLLGVSALTEMVAALWFLAIIPIIYISAITMISRGEVHGGDKKIISGAIALYAFVIITTLLLAFLPCYNIVSVIPFLLLFLYLTFPNLLKAYKKPGPIEIRNAVKGCVIALIALDATIAAGFAGWIYGLIVLCLLPVSFFIAKGFSVT